MFFAIYKFNTKIPRKSLFILPKLPTTPTTKQKLPTTTYYNLLHYLLQKTAFKPYSIYFLYFVVSVVGNIETKDTFF